MRLFYKFYYIFIITLIPLAVSSFGTEPINPIVSVIYNDKPIRLKKDPLSNLLIAQCSINGIPCNLIVDTAASHTTFDIQFIQKHFPDLPLKNIPIAPESNVKARPKLFAVQSFSLAGLHIKNYLGMALDLSPLQKAMNEKVDGILGMNYLSHIPFLLSVKNASIQFLDRAAFPTSCMKQLNIRRSHSGIFYIYCSRDGQTFQLALDSGSTISMAPQKKWPMDQTAHPFTVQTTDINGHQANVHIMRKSIPSTLYIGQNFHLENLSIVVTQTKENHLLGVDVLRYFDIIIDAPQGKIFALPIHNEQNPSP